MIFQENLKHYRETAGYESAKDFANKLGIKYTTYLAYESQEGREPKYDLLCKIAAALGVTTDELLGYSFNEYDKYKRMVQRAGFFVDDNSNHFEGSPRDEQVFVFYRINANDESEMDKVVFESRADFIRILKNAYSIYSKNTEKILDREIGLAIQYQRSKNVHQE